MGQGQPRVIIWTNLVVLPYTMLHTKFQGLWYIGSEKDFLSFLPYMGWLVDLGLTALWDCISVAIGPSPRERETEKRSDGREKNVQTTPTRTYGKRSRPLPYCNPN